MSTLARMPRTLTLALAFTLFAFAAAADDVQTLHALFDREWEGRMQRDPMFATSVGRH